MTPRLRGVVIGCGKIAEFHLRGWARLADQVEIVGLADRDPTAAEQRRAAFAPDARVYTDVRALLETERPDFVDLLTPPALHREQCLLARDIGAHVICQKPMTEALSDAQALVQEMADHPRLFVVHENHRYRPWFQEILRRHQTGFFGPLRFVRLLHHEPHEPAEAFKVNSPRGILLDYGIHLVDMVRALLGDAPRLFARTHRLNARVAGESLAQVSFLYPDASALVDVAWKRGGLPHALVEVVGEEGEACFEGTMTRGGPARFRLMKGRDVVHDETRDPTDDYAESFYLFQRDCVDAMQGRAPVPQPATDNLRTLAATFAAYQAADEGEIIEAGRRG